MLEREQVKDQAALLEAKLGTAGVKLILWDIDDTLTLTNPVFAAGINDFSTTILAQNPQLFPEEFNQELLRLNNTVHGIMSVRKDRWKWVCEKLISKYGAEIVPAIVEAYPHFEMIYQTPTPLKPGVLKAVQTLHQTRVKMGMLTHGNRFWKEFVQLPHMAALLPYFNFKKDILIVPEWEHKTAGDWAQAIGYFRYEPSQTLVIGDNKEGDIRAAARIGVQHLVWVDVQKGWDLYRQGELPPSTIVIQEMTELVDALIGNL